MNFAVNLVPLGELGEIVSGSTPDTSVKEYWGGDIPWITPADLTTHTGIYFRDNLRKITRAGYDSCSTKLLPKGSIIYSSRAPIGHCAVTTTPLCTNQGFKSIIPNEKLNSVYGFFALKFFTPQIVAQGRGATFAEINKEIFENLRIPLPPISEQKRIAAVLDKADRLRRQRHYALELSNTYLQSVFLEMFKEAEHRFKITRIEDIASQEKYALSSGPFGSNLTSANYTQKGVMVLRGLNISDGQLNLDDVKYVSKEKAQELSRSEVHPGDIVVVAVGSSGFACQIPLTLPRAIMSQNFNKVTPDLSKIDPTFLEYLINSQIVQQQFHQEITDTVRTFLSLTKLKTVKIPLPPLPLQQKFAQIVHKFERLRIQQREAGRQAEHLFQTLLHQAFEGNVGLGSGVDQDDPVEKRVQSSVVRSELKGSYVQLQMKY